MRSLAQAQLRAGYVLHTTWATARPTATLSLEHEPLSAIVLDAALPAVQDIEMDATPLPERNIDARRGGLD